MKISKWQSYTLCVCVIGGVMMVSPVKSAMAANNSNQITAAKQDKLSVTTQRILELHSKDGHINNTQQAKVEWVKQAQDGSYGPTRFSIPKFDGYDTPAKGMPNSLSHNENPNIPLTIYHIDFYKANERFDHNQALCQVDLKDEHDQIIVRHIYNVPYDRSMKVKLTAPKNMEFIKKADSEPLITGSYKFNRTVKVRNVNPELGANAEKEPSVQTPQKSLVEHPSQQTQTTDPQTVDEGTNTKSVTVANETTSTDNLLEHPVNQDKGTMTEQPVKHLVDTETETASPAVQDEAVEVNTMISKSTTRDSGTMTDEKIHPSVSDSSTMTDFDQGRPQSQNMAIQTETNHQLLVDTGVGEDNVITYSQDDSVMTDQVLPKKPTVDESTGTDANSIAPSSVNVDQSTQTSQINWAKEEVRSLAATKAPETSTAELDKKVPSLSSPSQLDDEKSHRRAVPFAKTKSAKRKASSQELATLSKYNHPFTGHQQKTPKNEKLPQTGNHTCQLVVACGVALLSVLGLFKTGKRH